MAVIDSNDKLVVQANGTGATFTDTSLSPKTITANGNATQVRRKITNNAAFFDGSGDAILVADHADWDFGTGDFTIETYVMFATASGDRVFYDRNNGTDMSFRWDSSVGMRLSIGGSTIKTEAWSPSALTWYHVACVRTSGTVRFFVNGVELGTGTANASNISYSSALNIGAYASGSGVLHGWLKMYRVSNSARYTGAFTPSESAFTSDSNTKLLLHFTTPATGPLGPSFAMDGTGDTVSAADHADWDLTGDLTVEAWINSASATSFGIATNGSGAGGWSFKFNSGFSFQIASADMVTAAETLTTNRWYHVAVTRSGNNWTIWLDGRSIGTATTATAVPTSTGNLRLGEGMNSGGGVFTTSVLLNGYMKMARISNTARYSAAFTPSTTGFTSDANTKLLAKADENNGATTVVDSGNTGHTLTCNGDAKIKYYEDYRNTTFGDSGNTGHTPYGTTAGNQKVDFVAAFGDGSAFLDGSGDYLETADHADWDFGAGAFTLEGWFKWSATGGNYFLITRSTGTSGTNECTIFHSANTFNVYIGGSTILSYYSFTPALNTWYHIAVSRTGTTVRFFVNGIQLGASGTSADAVSSSSKFFIGSRQAELFFNGFIDNARIANVARYTATFNPDSLDINPTAAGNMLLCF